MLLSDLWLADRQKLEGKFVHQVIAFAGEGKLADNSPASTEFRAFLALVPPEKLESYAIQCLESKFPESGFALQDIVNEIGRRLGFGVEFGRYRGVSNAIGCDGLWRTADGGAIIVEVKTTDAYRIDLGVQAGYKRDLVRAGQVDEDHTSILIVVGRQDTGDLEAQVRGSRYAWEIRLISVDGLLRLLRLKADLERPDVIRKIQGILRPYEFTRVDGIIDLVFSAAEEARHEDLASNGPEIERDDEEARKPKFTPVNFREACIQRLERYWGKALVKRTAAFYLTPDGDLGVCCAISKEHVASSSSRYWFAFHTHQKDVLEQTKEAYVSFGCGAPEKLILIPFAHFANWISNLNVTEEEYRSYWHVHIQEKDGQFWLLTRGEFENVAISQYVLAHGG